MISSGKYKEIKEELSHNSIFINYGIYGGDFIYNKVKVRFNDETIEYFDCGDFVKDWYNGIKYLMKSKLNDFTMSRTVRNFILESPVKYDNVFLIKNNNIWEFNRHGNNGIEFFVPKGKLQTWKELNSYCNEK